MRPINTKERSKLFWQFIFIVFGLCFLPVGIIFCAYYQAPVEISREAQEKLNNYSQFEHQQKILVKQLSDIGDSIVALNNGNNVNLLTAEPMISNAIANVKTTDTGNLVKTIAKSYTSFLNAADAWHKCTEENKKLNADMVAASAKIKDFEAAKNTRDALMDAARPH